MIWLIVHNNQSCVSQLSISSSRPNTSLVNMDTIWTEPFPDTTFWTNLDSGFEARRDCPPLHYNTSFTPYVRVAHGLADSLNMPSITSEYNFQVGLKQQLSLEHQRPSRHISPVSQLSSSTFDTDVNSHIGSPSAMPSAFNNMMDDHPHFYAVSKEPLNRICQLPSTLRATGELFQSTSGVTASYGQIFDPRQLVHHTDSFDSDVGGGLDDGDRLAFLLDFDRKQEAGYDSGVGASLDDNEETSAGDDDDEETEEDADTAAAVDDDGVTDPDPAPDPDLSTDPDDINGDENSEFDPREHSEVRTSRSRRSKMTSIPSTQSGARRRSILPYPPSVRVGKKVDRKPVQLSGNKNNTYRRQSSARQRPLRKVNLPCPFHPFGCEAAFPSKNEWKRHALSQHLCLGYYRCDMGACAYDHPSGMTVSRGFNDFNRKDLFTQHCRRMHKFNAWGAKEYNQVSKTEKEEFDAYMDDVRDRCWVRKRDAPGKIGCGLCGEVFIEGEGGRDVWESRMEHVAKHYEFDVDKDTEKADEDFLQWAVDNDIVRSTGDGYLLTSLARDVNDSSGSLPSSAGQGRNKRKPVPSAFVPGRRSLRSRDATQLYTDHDEDDEDSASSTTNRSSPAVEATKSDDSDTDAEGELDE
jgi:hypothetical protein